MGKGGPGIETEVSEGREGSTPPAGAEMVINEGRVGGPLPVGAEIGVNEGLTF